MSYKVLQQRIRHGGQSFHFVSYDAQPGNVKRGEAAMGPMWYLMRAGKRWPAIPQVVGQSEAESMAALGSWLQTEMRLKA